MLEWFAKNSLLVTAAPWPFFIFFALSALGSAAFLDGSTRNASRCLKTENILDLGVNLLVVGQYYSMRVVIPPGRTLQVQLLGRALST
jgi:hypothetical protein